MRLLVEKWVFERFRGCVPESKNTPLAQRLVDKHKALNSGTLIKRILIRLKLFDQHSFAHSVTPILSPLVLLECLSSPDRSVSS